MVMSTDMGSAAEIDAAIARELAAFPEVAAAWLFGSVARGQARRDSDIDIAVLLRDRSLTLASSHRLVRTLAARLERAAPGRPVDLVLLAAQSPIFVHRVLTDGRLVLDADVERRIDFESNASSRYFDFLPTYRMAASVARDGIRRWLERR